MSKTYKNIVNGRAWSLAACLQLAVAAALILVLAGCGTSNQSGSPGQTGADRNGPSTAQEKASGTPETAREKTSAPRGEPAGTTSQAPRDAAGLGTPALGDSGAPVVMVEYADYQ